MEPTLKSSALELRIPPPVVAALAALLMWRIAHDLPGLDVAFNGAPVAAGLLAAAGAILAAAGVWQFLRARTTIHPMKPSESTALVTAGIYRYTRNPMYLGLSVVLLGWAVYLQNPAALLVIPVFIAYLTRFQIVPEEKALTRNFGVTFDDYCSRVRRWL